MALGALIAAYEESEEGGLRALIPMAGRPLVDAQVRSAAAAGAAPIVVLVDQAPQALTSALDRLRSEGINLVVAEDAAEVAARFEPDDLILQIADGIVPDTKELHRLAAESSERVLTVPDDSDHERFERIDLTHRWAGLSLVEGREIGATAAMLGDWDLSSTLLRRAVQAGAELDPGTVGEGRGPLFVDRAEDAEDYTRRLLAASKGERRDWVARYILPPLDDALTSWLSASPIRPGWLLMLAILLTGAAIPAFLFDQPILATILLVLSMPLDLVARRVAVLRLRPIAPSDWRLHLPWPLFAVSLLAWGWWLFAPAGWGALLAAVCLVVFAEALRPLRDSARLELWLFARRPAIFLMLPFAIFGQWLAGLLALTTYAGASLILAQRLPKT